MVLPLIVAALLSNVMGLLGFTVILTGAALIWKQFLLGAVLFSAAFIVALLIALGSFKAMAQRGEFKASTVAFTLISMVFVLAAGYFLPSVAATLNIAPLQSQSIFSVDSAPSGIEQINVSATMLFNAVKPYLLVGSFIGVLAFVGIISYNSVGSGKRR